MMHQGTHAVANGVAEQRHEPMQRQRIREAAARLTRRPFAGAHRSRIGTAALTLALLTLGAAGQSRAQGSSPWDPEPGSPGSFSLGDWICPFGGAPISGYDILALVGIAVALVILAVMFYRLMVEDLIRRGLRPSLLGSTVTNLAVGTWLLAAFALIPDVLGVCWFAILGAVFLLWLVALAFSGRVLAGAVAGFVLLAAAVVVVLQLVFV